MRTLVWFSALVGGLACTESDDSTTAVPGEFDTPAPIRELPGPQIARSTPRPVQTRPKQRPSRRRGGTGSISTPLGPLRVGKPLYEVGDIMVLAATMSLPARNVEVKFVSDSAPLLSIGSAPIHPLDRGAEIEAYLEDPALYISSRPFSGIVPSLTGKDRSRGRFSVRESWGEVMPTFMKSVSTSVPYETYLVSVLQFAMQAFRALEKLHAAGIVHGSISPYSFRIAGDVSTGRINGVKLADFEHAFNATDGFALTHPPVEYASLRELSGELTNARDDMHHLLQVVANLASNGSWIQEFRLYLEAAIVPELAAMEYKNDNFFLPHNRMTSEAFGELSKTSRRRDLQSRMETINDHIATIEYDEIVDIITHVVDLITDPLDIS